MPRFLSRGYRCIRCGESCEQRAPEGCTEPMIELGEDTGLKDGDGQPIIKWTGFYCVPCANILRPEQ